MLRHRTRRWSRRSTILPPTSRHFRHAFCLDQSCHRSSACPLTAGHSRSAVAAATDRAAATFRDWSGTAISQRARHLRALARTLRSEQTALASLLTAEVGKPIAQSLAEIEKCALVCDYYAKEGPRFLAPERPPGAPAHAHVEFAPLGIVLAIMPWNFPFWQVFRAVAPILMAGNTVLLKHAANVSGCALAIEQLFLTAGCRRGVSKPSSSNPPASPGLIADPRIRAVTMTGSTAAGKESPRSPAPR